jgi:hypothetical protein
MTWITESEDAHREGASTRPVYHSQSLPREDLVFVKHLGRAPKLPTAGVSIRALIDVS